MSPTNSYSSYNLSSLVASGAAGVNNIQHTVISVNVAFMVVVACMVGLRMYVRLRITGKVGVDDVLIAAAGIFAITLSGVVLSALRYGLGKHILDQGVDQIIPHTVLIIKLLFVCSIVYSTAMTLTKASIIAMYLRIFPNAGFRYVMWFTLSVVLAMWMCTIFVTVFQCNPVQGAWDFRISEKTCISYRYFSYAAAGINVATDLILCTFPIPFFWRLDLAVKERVIVCALFACGLFATLASVFRLTQLHNLQSDDLTYKVVPSLDWSVIEVGTAILCASVPGLKPLLTRLWPGRLISYVARSLKLSDGNHRHQLRHRRASQRLPPTTPPQRPEKSVGIISSILKWSQHSDDSIRTTAEKSTATSGTFAMLSRTSDITRFQPLQSQTSHHNHHNHHRLDSTHTLTKSDYTVRAYSGNHDDPYEPNYPDNNSPVAHKKSSSVVTTSTAAQLLLTQHSLKGIAVERNFSVVSEEERALR